LLIASICIVVLLGSYVYGQVLFEWFQRLLAILIHA